MTALNNRILADMSYSLIWILKNGEGLMFFIFPLWALAQTGAFDLCTEMTC
jgi:hypothetical protein